MREQVARKATYILLMLTFAYAYAVAFLYSLLYARRSRPDRISRIAAVWYNPRDLTGSNLRLGHWQRYFEEAGLHFDSFWVLDLQEFRDGYESASWPDRYLFYRRLLLRRLRQFLKLRHYDVVWIARGFLPYFPLRHAFFERCLRRMGLYVVVDSTDGGDYLGNPELVLDTMAQADRVTVAFRFLREFYEQRFPDVVHIEWTIPQDPYILKSDYSLNPLPTLGWMGSPGNFEHLAQLRSQLAEVAKVRPFRLLYLCRQDMKFEIPGAVVEHRQFDESYYRVLAEFDIGLCPYLQDNMRTQGKIGMKHQEFLLCGIPQVCSPVAISEYVVDGEHALIARTPGEWTAGLLRLLTDAPLRGELGRRSRDLFLAHYTYEGEFARVYGALTDFTTPTGAGVPRSRAPAHGRMTSAADSEGLVLDRNNRIGSAG